MSWMNLSHITPLKTNLVQRDAFCGDSVTYTPFVILPLECSPTLEMKVQFTIQLEEI